MSGLFDAEAMADLEARGLVSRPVHAHCEVGAEDFIVARRIEQAGTADARVAIAIQETTDEGQTVGISVVLSPAVARAYAAHLLNLADEADGTAPLVFHPKTPDGVDPFTR